MQNIPGTIIRQLLCFAWMSQDPSTSHQSANLLHITGWNSKHVFTWPATANIASRSLKLHTMWEKTNCKACTCCLLLVFLSPSTTCLVTHLATAGLIPPSHAVWWLVCSRWSVHLTTSRCQIKIYDVNKTVNRVVRPVCVCVPCRLQKLLNCGMGQEL